MLTLCNAQDASRSSEERRHRRYELSPPLPMGFVVGFGDLWGCTVVQFRVVANPGGLPPISRFSLPALATGRLALPCGKEPSSSSTDAQTASVQALPPRSRFRYISHLHTPKLCSNYITKTHHGVNLLDPHAGTIIRQCSLILFAKGVR